jgi:hypothetical protein
VRGGRAVADECREPMVTATNVATDFVFAVDRAVVCHDFGIYISIIIGDGVDVRKGLRVDGIISIGVE